MERNIERVMFTQQQLQSKIQEMAAQISEEYAGKNPVFVGVLKGVVLFFSDFYKNVTIPCQMDFICISSYEGQHSTGKHNLKLDITTDIRGRHVVILEDVFDTGRTLEFTYRHLLAKEPASVKIVTLLDKPSRRDPNVTLQADMVGFEIPNEFVVGYGLDYDEYYRNLPYIGVMKPEAYQ